MFRLSLAPAQESKVKFWRIATGVTTAGSGVTSIGAIVPKIKEALPEGTIIEQFTYMAIAVALVTGLVVLFFPCVLSVSLAQLGVATSIMLLGYSLLGAFPPTYLLYARILIGLVALVLVVSFTGGLAFFYRQKSWSDLILGIVLLIPFVFLWLYPLTHALK